MTQIGLWNSEKHDAQIIVYSTATCPYCSAVKEYLKSRKVEFEEKRVDLDNGALKEMIEKSGQMGVPVVDVGGMIIVGFNKPAINAALR
ncbi:MAG: glutaredoxin family protein [Candidatus Micrarchaeia archaeon]